MGGVVASPLPSKHSRSANQSVGFLRGLALPSDNDSHKMTIADSLLLGQSASGLNFYDDSGRSQLAD